MKIFAIIVFGLAVIRTVAPFANKKAYKTSKEFIANALLASTMMIAYIWFLKQLGL